MTESKQLATLDSEKETALQLTTGLGDRVATINSVNAGLNIIEELAEVIIEKMQTTKNEIHYLKLTKALLSTVEASRKHAVTLQALRDKERLVREKDVTSFDML